MVDRASGKRLDVITVAIVALITCCSLSCVRAAQWRPWGKAFLLEASANQ
jgi:hypothetical protein